MILELTRPDSDGTKLYRCLCHSDASLGRYLVGFGVVPSAVCSDQRIGLMRPPSAAPVGASTGVLLQDRIDHRPRGFDRVFTGEERPIADHGVGQEPLVGR